MPGDALRRSNKGEVCMKTNSEVMKDDAPIELSEKELAEVGGGRRVILY
jgi:hypothetical protein